MQKVRLTKRFLDRRRKILRLKFRRGEGTLLRLIISGSIFLCFILSTILCRAQENWSAIVGQIRPSTITVLSYDKEGRAFNMAGGVFVGKNGDVITNRRVFMGADHAAVRTIDGMLYSVKTVLGEDKVANLIRIGVEIPQGKVSPLLLNTFPPQLGERIAVIDSLAQPEQSFSYGTVLAFEEIPTVGRIIRVTAPISSSLDGCPVVNMKGEVMGMVTSWRVEGKNFHFVIPSERLIGLKIGREISLAEWEGRKEETAESLYAKGLPFLWKEDYDKAVFYFEKAVKVDPCYANAYFLLGYCNAQLGRYPAALEAYKKAVQMQPDFVLAHFFLGLIYLEARDKSHALAEYKILRGLDKNYADDLLNMIR